MLVRGAIPIRSCHIHGKVVVVVVVVVVVAEVVAVLVSKRQLTVTLNI